MQDIISVEITDDHLFKCSTYYIARKGEGLIPRLTITIPVKLYDSWAYLDFKKPDGEKLRTPRLKIIDGVIIYDIPLYLLDKNGEIGIQAVFQKDSGAIWKSNIKKFAILQGIDAVVDIPDKQDFIVEAQKVLDSAVATAKSIEERANNGEFDGEDGVGRATANGGEIFNDYENNKATGIYSHAEGKQNTVKGNHAHGEGSMNTVNGADAHGEGWGNTADAPASHVEGGLCQTYPNATYGHAGGKGCIANAMAQRVVGTYNKLNDKALFIVGNGTSDTNRSNAFEVYRDGSITIGGVHITPEQLQKLVSLIG